MTRRRLTTTLALVLLASGCGRAKKLELRRRSSLEDAAKAYNERVRTGEPDRAIEFVAPSDREIFLEEQGKLLKAVRFTEVRVGHVELPAGANEATVTVTRSFYRLADLVERTETLQQKWLWKDGRWFVTVARPAP